MSYDSVFRPGLFAGRTIVVTGGGSGLGRCTAHELKSLGARLALIGRTQAKLDQVKEELGDPDTFTFAADLRDEAQVKAAIDGVLAWLTEDLQRRPAPTDRLRFAMLTKIELLWRRWKAPTATEDDVESPP